MPKPFLIELRPELISFEKELESGPPEEGPALRPLDWDLEPATEEDEGVSTDATPDVDEVVGTLWICTLNLRESR